MKALVYHGPGHLMLEDVPDPKPGAGEAVLKVQACGICGTDLRIEAGSHRAYGPGTVRTPGHEIAGTIVEAGPDTELRVGATAFVAPNIGCGRCRMCRPRGGGTERVNLCVRARALGITENGAMAEYVLLPRDLVEQGNVLPISDGADPAALALVEPLACVLRGSKAVDVREGDVVLICGAGPIGLLHLQVARLRRPAAIVVSEPGQERREKAAAWGADHVVDPANEDLSRLISEVSVGRGADVIIVAAPSPKAQEQSVRLAAPGGRINLFGGLPSGSSITFDSNPIHYKELIVTGTTANSNADCREALGLFLSGALDTLPLISRRLALSESREAFDAARSGQSLKVVFEP
jgi:L-iditol 2-dehydrogenase